MIVIFISEFMQINGAENASPSVRLSVRLYATGTEQNGKGKSETRWPAP